MLSINRVRSEGWSRFREAVCLPEEKIKKGCYLVHSLIFLSLGLRLALDFAKALENFLQMADDMDEKRHAKEPEKEKQKKIKDKSGDFEEKTTDTAKLRMKLEKLDAKIDALKAKKEEVIKQLFELEGTVNN
ncbi:hypothetical protein B296_00021570 [Ensete ventricosum]|uniref:Uncharacterized protein n=1 Tax=Ensete ventricosum TaxID=4639 RepID=A0A426YDN4_ENSVE|nr:hypothetical protein B296_00021570 [Ensete ventricosum]